MQIANFKVRTIVVAKASKCCLEKADIYRFSGKPVRARQARSTSCNDRTLKTAGPVLYLSLSVLEMLLL